jgi:hypothetical protein
MGNEGENEKLIKTTTISEIVYLVIKGIKISAKI